MSECPTCKIGFGPKFRYCPNCRVYEANVEDRIDFLEHSAAEAFDGGASQQDVETMLVYEGLSPERARLIAAGGGRSAGGVALFYGVRRLVAGLVVGAVGVCGVATTLFSGRLDFRVAVLSVGAAVVGFGLACWGVATIALQRR